MPYFANYDGEERQPDEVPKASDCWCVECGERMRVWDPADYARHFKHIGAMGGGSGEGGYSACDSVAESDQHKHWKFLTRERLRGGFSGDVKTVAEERRLDAPHSSAEHRQADVLMTFSSPDEQLCRGLAVEIQHKNETKDKAAVARDYAEQDIATVWTDSTDYATDRCKLKEVDFRHRARMDTPWEKLVPIQELWGDADHTDTIPAEMIGGRPPVPATMPPDWYDHHAERIWREQAWTDLFSPPTNHTDIWCYAHVPATMPPDWYDRKARRRWEEEPWPALFDEPTPYTRELIKDFDLDAPTEIRATYHDEWFSGETFFSRQRLDLVKRLREANATRTCDVCGSEADYYLFKQDSVSSFRCAAHY